MFRPSTSLFRGALLLAAFPALVRADGTDPLFSASFEAGAISLSPDLVHARAGTTVAGIGGPLLLRLDEPVLADTFVAIQSLSPERLLVDGGGATVLAGEDSAIVRVQALAADPTPVLLRTLLGNPVYASVRVVDDSEPRRVLSLRPNPLSIARNGSRNLIATLDLPAASTGTTVDLTVAPSGAGTLPASIVVVGDRFSQSFSYTDLDVAEFATISASVALTPPAQAAVAQSPVGKLVINEIDYDQPEVDAGEYIEIYNRSPDTVPLADLAVVLVEGGGGNEYARYNLGDAAASLAAGEYLLLASPGKSPPPGVAFIDLGGEAIIANDAPSAVAIIDTAALTVIDALSYGGSVDTALIEGFADPQNLVEGTPLVATDDESGARSLARIPNGTDVGNADTDFVATSLLTPGLNNDPAPPSGHLVINEVDYDQAGTDAASYIEIYNGTGAPVPLANIAIVLVNGNGNVEYARHSLAGAGSTLAAGQYLLVRNASVSAPPGVLTIDVAGDFVQNGPDGIALIDSASNTLIDALSYEGSLTSATITGFPGPVSLVEGTAFAGADSNDNLHTLVRIPNGSDSDNAVVDWVVSTNFTPGTANLP
jgi:hypothetical protein